MVGRKTEQPVRIVAFGDSTTDTRNTIDKVYAVRLAEALPAHGVRAIVMNAGVGGNTTRDAAKRFETDVLVRRPDLVILQFGINDSVINVWETTNPRVPQDEYARTLRQMASTLTASGIGVIVMTPNSMRWHPDIIGLYGKPPYDVKDPKGFNLLLTAYAETVRQIARELGVPLVDVFAAFEEHGRKDGRAVDDLLLDGVHPNDTGHAMIAELLLPVIVSRNSDPAHRILSAPIDGE